MPDDEENVPAVTGEVYKRSHQSEVPSVMVLTDLSAKETRVVTIGEETISKRRRIRKADINDPFI